MLSQLFLQTIHSFKGFRQKKWRDESGEGKQVKKVFSQPKSPPSPNSPIHPIPSHSVVCNSRVDQEEGMKGKILERLSRRGGRRIERGKGEKVGSDPLQRSVWLHLEEGTVTRGP